MKYQSKPVIKEAIQWDGTLTMARHIEKEFGNITRAMNYHEGRNECSSWSIGTLEGTHIVSVGDYVIRGLKGECYLCKPDIFEMTYEPIEQQ